MEESLNINALMNASGVKFGTSGARGLVSSMTDRVCFAYTVAFLQHLERSGQLTAGTPVAIAGDLRPSTPRIMRAIGAAALHRGNPVENSGYVPSPAVALRGLKAGIPSIMVTGSHIPADRNGIKFNGPDGEITKDDEAGIRQEVVHLPAIFGDGGSLRSPPGLPVQSSAAANAYRHRWLDAFPSACLKGMRLGIYGHSAVGRDLLAELCRAFGAQVVRLGWSDAFVPVDTEAIRDEDVELARGWATEHRVDAILSTDGDSDRPLIADQTGEFLRGDVAGVIAARYLQADAVATPVSCNTVVEKCGAFDTVIRTRIGSPHVIAGMQSALQAGRGRVVGYEANGGFLTASPLPIPGGSVLPALPTRDPLIVQLAVLLDARSRGVPVSALRETLPSRHTASGRLQRFERLRSDAFLERLAAGTLADAAGLLGLGAIAGVDNTDGRRISLASGDIVHFRPSGNAPELRCYAEAATADRAAELVAHGLGLAESLSAAAE